MRSGTPLGLCTDPAAEAREKKGATHVPRKYTWEAPGSVGARLRRLDADEMMGVTGERALESAGSNELVDSWLEEWGAASRPSEWSSVLEKVTDTSSSGGKQG